MSVEDKVKEIIVDQLGVDEKQVTSEASFIDDLGADSLDTVELVMALEAEFDIEIPDEEAEKIATVQDATSYINGTGYGEILEKLNHDTESN